MALAMFSCCMCGATVSFQGSEYEPQATKHWNRRVEDVPISQHNQETDKKW